MFVTSICTDSMKTFGYIRSGRKQSSQGNTENKTNGKNHRRHPTEKMKAVGPEEAPGFTDLAMFHSIYITAI